ncbi:5-carboxymethylaminomethyluridine-tRNA synthase GTPase subunit [Gammaproteobacteria bacterium]
MSTIAAIATAHGRGAIGVVRISGPKAKHIAREILGRELSPRQATFLPFLDAEGLAIDEGLVLWFPAPHSYTGEDTLELQGHGGNVVLDQVLARVLSLGARLAKPGEFTERAFLQGKLDLARAEAVADLIDAASTQAARAAVRSLQGVFSKQIKEIVSALTHLRMHVEATLDFPDEELDSPNNTNIQKQLFWIQKKLVEILASAQEGVVLREGMTVVIAGQPNVGKSSLLNCLAKREVAIVSPFPGTTRDVLRESILLDGMPLNILDTAGLRITQDFVEQEGVRRAYAEIERADQILLVVEDKTGVGSVEKTILERLSGKLSVTVVRNKADLTNSTLGLSEGLLGPEVTLSATTGAGISELVQHLKRVVGHSANTGTFSARRRHLTALKQAQNHVDAAEKSFRFELLAEELRLAQDCLGEITGAVTSDDLLGKIFKNFCIGK